MKDKNKSKSGFVLAIALALTGAAMILVGGAIAYTSFATRQTNIMVGKSVCRLAAQTAIEATKDTVNSSFQRSIAKSARRVGLASGEVTVDDSYGWFGNSTTPSQTIGKSPNVVTLPATTNINGCSVRVRIGRVFHETGKSSAEVTFVATATRANPGGSVSSSTIEETVRYAAARSQVFNNAYFVNNYGWFQGSGATANGDVRSNGDMFLDTGCKINGRVYASQNDELRVDGNVDGYGTMDNYNTYKSGSYGTSNRARPLLNDYVTHETNPGGYDAPNSNKISDQTLRNRINANLDTMVEMPYIGDLSSDESDYRLWAEELHAANPNLATIKKGGQTLVSVYYDGVGPSGVEYQTDAAGNRLKDSDGKDLRAADYGALVLEGTENDPIVINGPVIIPSDVIIKGYVTGQGTIYSGRNIHIVGDIKYKNPPQWANKSTSNTSNSSKDMLGLMAKGNIVLGDYTESGWLTSISKFLSKQPYVQQYACDTSDASIGYPETFGGDYTVEEWVGNADFNKCKNAGLADFIPGGYKASTGKFGKAQVAYMAGEVTQAKRSDYYYVYNTNKNKIEYKWVSWGDYYTPIVQTVGTAYNRKYYESVCLDTEISSRYKSAITRIDAILYNNHGIFGHLGKCSINGSLVCRNEGIQYSEALYLNWDIRLYSGSNETIDNDSAGLARSRDNPPATIAWQEIPDSENPEPLAEGTGN